MTSNFAFMTIKGSSQGFISKGAGSSASLGENSYLEGHEDEIRLFSFLYASSNPAHSSSGAPLGMARSKPFQIMKRTDKSTPLLLNALSNAETLPEVVIKVYRISITGQQEHFLTYTLKDAKIASMDMQIPLETLFLTYRSVTIEHIRAATISHSDWVHSPVVVDKSLILRIADGAYENFVTTNRILYEWGGGVFNSGALGAGALSNYLYNKSQKNIFFKEPRASILKIMFQELGKVTGLRPMGFNFRSLGPVQGTLYRALFPALQNAFYFEVGVVIGSVATATIEELHDELCKHYIECGGE